MNFEITWTITAIIALVSLISPILVTILNNRHDYKVRRLENFSKLQQEILFNFSTSITKNFNSNSIHSDFRKDLNLLNIYFDVNEKLIEKIMKHEYKDVNEFQDDVNKVMKSLSKQIKSK